MGSHFRSYIWDPVLIVSQILLMQCIYYSFLGLWLAGVDCLVQTSRSLNQMFSYDVRKIICLPCFILHTHTHTHLKLSSKSFFCLTRLLALLHCRAGCPWLHSSWTLLPRKNFLLFFYTSVDDKSSCSSISNPTGKKFWNYEVTNFFLRMKQKYMFE